MSLINDALKRAAESQGQAQTRPRGPKGVEDLPVPMTPAASRERPAWLSAAGIGLLIVALLSASGFFFAKWWKERQSWQPYAETPPDEGPAANAVDKAKAPPNAKQTQTVTKAPPVTPPAVTNPPVKTNVTVAITPPTTPVTPEPPTPKATNPVVSVAVNPPPTPPTNPPAVVKVETNQIPVVPPPVKPTPPPVTPDTAKVAAVEFPDLKLQGIIRGKKKTTAVVNGKTLSLGDRIDGAFLLKIDQESVTFEKGSVRKELFLLR